MGNKPLLEIFTVCWNESKILPDFIKWYRDKVPNCLITVYDNNSDDNTFGIALDNECKVIPFDTGGYMDEQTLMDIRNNCWKQSEAKWCLVVDCDELVNVTVEMLIPITLTTVYKCKGFEMFGTEEDTIETLDKGLESVGYSKPVLFKPYLLKELNLTPGSHDCNPIHIDKKGEVRIVKDYPNMFHTKWRSWSNGIERARLLAKRRSEHSKQMGWNFHYELDESVHLDYYTNGIKNRVKVR